MSLCRLMQYDFMYGTGRHDTYGELYSDNDLRYGRQYARDYINAGLSHEPLMGFNLRDFALWCNEQLKEPTRDCV